MEGDDNQLINISFSAPHQMGFLQFDEHHNLSSCFLPTASPEISQGGATANNNGSLGFNHDQLLLDNNDQVRS